MAVTTLLYSKNKEELPEHIKVTTKVHSPLIDFALQELITVAEAKDIKNLRVQISLNKSLKEQEFSMINNNGFSVSGGSELGLMYGILELAEQLKITENQSLIKNKNGKPFIERRGIKFNIPLDARTPSYDDTGDAALKNISEMWNMDFWIRFFDEMAKCRYNTLTLWNPHPFPSMIKLKDYPEVALNDVCVPSIEPVYEEGIWGDPMNLNELVANNLRVVKNITIDEKISFWQEVMAYAKNRGIKIYFITWNINLNSVAPPAKTRYFAQKQLMGNITGKYGINNDQNNENAIAYLRACVKEFILTYPDLAGIGVTPSENMEDREDEFDREKWLYKTYGKGVEDAKKEQPNRNIEMIHRVWLSGMDRIVNDFAQYYPDTLTLSFKYAKARLYSSIKPPFADDYLPLLKEYKLKSWWNLRNDDIFHFRWGDPDYVREFLRNLPSEEYTAGYHMGSDGYVWGREHISKYPESPRQLEIEKHWFKFMLWGRLGYDNQLSNDFFVKIIKSRLPGTNAPKLFEAWSSASKIVPLVNQFHWRDWDFHWAVEGSFDCRRGFNNVYDFINCPTMQASGILTIPEYAEAVNNQSFINGTTPIQIADSLEFYANKALNDIDLKYLSSNSVEALNTLADIEAFAHLGNYYANKIRGAVALQFALKNYKNPLPLSSAQYLRNSYKDWKKYAKTATDNYNPQMLARTRILDWNKLSVEVEKDIEQAELIEQNNWNSIFNGKNLDGWHVKSNPLDKENEFFKVKDGELKINSLGNSDHDYVWLMSDSVYSDFAIRFEFKMDGVSKGNSGLQIRSRYDDKSSWLDGPQIDLCPEPLWRTGMIWDETRENKRWLYPDIPVGEWVDESMKADNHFIKTKANSMTWGDWNRMLIIAKGTNIKVYLNDKLVTDYNGKEVLTDKPHQLHKVGLTGQFAFQVHTKEEVKLEVRKIFVAKLSK